jgi:type II restriction enzyme
MRLEMPVELGAGYTSGAQRTRVVSEAWGERNLYCVNCSSAGLRRAAPNTQAIDFTCPECASPFQLKSQAQPFSSRIADAAYGAMCRAIMENRTPNLMVLHYDRARWEVENLILVPRFVFSLSLLQRRKPLGPRARRRGWIGCNILLANVPPDGRIPIVAGGVATSPAWVREQYARLRPLGRLGHEARGWTLDVLNVLRRLGKGEFTLAEVYARGEELRRLHPQNRYVEAKIRQQLQRLRDMGFLEFLGGGSYRIV